MLLEVKPRDSGSAFLCEFSVHLKVAAAVVQKTLVLFGRGKLTLLSWKNVLAKEIVLVALPRCQDHQQLRIY